MVEILNMQHLHNPFSLLGCHKNIFVLLFNYDWKQIILRLNLDPWKLAEAP